MFYYVRDEEDGKFYSMTLHEILDEINRDRSEEWIDYDESDWREGLEQWTFLILLGEGKENIDFN